MKIAYIVDRATPVKGLVTRNSFFFEVDKFENFEKVKDYDYVVITAPGSELHADYEALAKTYLQEDAIMLPLVVLKTAKTTGVLNTCLWNTNLPTQYGELDHELALKQIDLTLYGALIPTKYLREEYFNKDIKYYQHFHFLNKATKDGVPVIGVPKTLLTTDVDLFHEEASTEEKTKYFNMAKEV